jgi:hypothetical protein
MKPDIKTLEMKIMLALKQVSIRDEDDKRIVADGIKELERIFALDEGKQAMLNVLTSGVLNVD